MLPKWRSSCPRKKTKELVTVSVKMSKLMYTQLREQAIERPKRYPDPKNLNLADFDEFQLGAKIACGLEMTYQKGKRLVLEEEKSISFEAYILNLQNNNYFQGENSQSRKYLKLMKVAEEHYHIMNQDSEMMKARVRSLDKLLDQPYSADDFKGDVAASDNDNWCQTQQLERLNSLYKRENELNAYNLKDEKKRIMVPSEFDTTELRNHMEGFMARLDNNNSNTNRGSGEVPKKKLMPLLALNTLIVAGLVAFQYCNAPSLTYTELYLAMQSPWNVCKFETCLPNVVDDRFTIHGMWPMHNGRSIQSKCSATFDWKMMKDRDWRDLEDYWPNLLASSSNMQFWNHEWACHGRAFEGDQAQYFGRAIELYKGLQLDDAFYHIGMRKGKTYSATQTIERLRRETGLRCILKCRTLDSKNNIHLLVEVIFCAAPDGKTFQDCTEATNCKDFRF